MNPRHLTGHTLCTVACLILPGCGDSSSTTPGSNQAENPPAVAQPQADGRQPAADAAQALLAVVEGFQQHRPQAIWEFLPPSHQQQINQLARQFARRMDAPLWQKTAAVARDSAGLLKNRKQQILSHPALKESPLAADGALEQKWDGFVALLETVAGSELADLDKMKSFDGRDFFSRFNADSLGQLRELSILLAGDNPFSLLGEMLDGATIRQVEQNGDAAVVEIHPGNGKPRTFAFTRVEGQWIPTAWAGGFKRDIEQARARIEVELAPDILARKKKLVMPYLDNAGRILSDLRAASTEQEFHALMTDEIIKPALSAAAATTANTPSGVDLSSGGDTVTIIVNKELTPDQIDEIADALLSSAGDDRELTESSGPGQTRFVISPVKNVAPFARTIRFGKVVSIDAAKRTIHVAIKVSGTVSD